MNFLPKTRAGWGRLLVLPLQLCVATGWIALAVYANLTGRHRDYEFYDLIVYLYGFCILGLGAGAWFQRSCGDRSGSNLSLFMAIVALVLLPMCLPAFSRP